MPIDKFGRHITRVQAYSLSPQPSVLPEPPTYHSKCFITIRGSFQTQRNATFFTLENGTTNYRFPVSGKIENVVIFPNNVEISTNKKDIFTAEKLVGQDIKKGDTFEFLALKSKSPLYVEIVLQCPLSKDG